LHGQSGFARQNKGLDQKNEKTWMWLRTGQLKRETEAAQDQAIRTNYIKAKIQAIRTNYIKAKIDKTREKPNCRMCNQMDKTVLHR